MASRIFATFRPPGRPAPRPAPPPQYPYEAPAHFFAEVTVQSGGEAGLRARALSNNLGKPVAIHEIRINIGMDGVPGQALALLDPGSFVEVSLTLDGKPITEGFVPAWIFGRSDNFASEVVLGSPIVSSASTNALSTATWRLPQPMLMRPGSAVSATVRHRGAVLIPATVGVSLVGKQIAGGTGLTRVPYVAAFLATPRDYNVVGSEASPESALWNSTKRTLNVERLTGRILTTAALSTAVLSDDRRSGDALTKYVTLQMALSTGQPIVRDPTPFGAVFSPASGSTLELPFTLLPGEYLIATVAQTARPGTVSATFGASYKIQPQIALSGWREE